MAKNQHVVRNPKGGWSVRGEGNSRATANTETQQQAIDVARNIAQNQGSDVVVHGRDGRIRDRSSYGNDPHPPKG